MNVNSIYTSLLRYKALVLSNSRTNDSVFSLFYSGRHHAALKYFDSKSLQDFSTDELHYIFASMVAINRDRSAFIQHLPEPLSLKDFNDAIQIQIEKELHESKRGILQDPKHLKKLLLAAALGIRSRKKYFVETGTFTGQSLLKVVHLFEELHTVEASPFLYKASSALFSELKQTNVKSNLGDARTFLAALDPNVCKEAVFFLDAHYSTGITSKAFGSCPVIEELAIILSKAPDALIVVDDIRAMDGRNGYPTLNEILDSLNHTTTVRIAFDLLIIGDSSVVEDFLK